MNAHPLLEVVNTQKLKENIKDIPDFPKKGVLFKDITPLLQDPALFRSTIRRLAELVQDKDFTKFVAIESRGFLLGSALCEYFHKGLVLVRKPGKLPRKTISHTYELEYGTDTLEIHAEDIGAKDKIIIIDDVLATGGTAHATETLCLKTGAHVVGHLFLIELLFLEGQKKLKAPSLSLIQY